MNMASWRTFAAGLAVGATVVASSTPSIAQGSSAGAKTWVAAWGTSQQVLGNTPVTNATVRMISRVTIPGGRVRIRLDNTFGTEPVTIGHASIGYRVQGAAVAAGSSRPLTFSAISTVTIPAGGSVWSDPASVKVLAQQDLAISLYIPGTNVKPSQHSGAVVTSYRSADASGDLVADETRAPFTTTTTSMWWLKAIDVESDSSVAQAGAIIAFGDSITDGTCTTLDAHDRWEDVVSMRLALEPGGKPMAVVNEGIGGNTVTREGLTPPVNSTPGIERLDRDVLSHHGVSTVVLFMGTNDINRGALAAQVIAGMTSIVERVKAKGIRTIGVTIIPRYNVAPAGNSTAGWTPERTAIRHEINQWIRTKAPFDKVIDFDKVVRDPASVDLLYQPFNCGDNIHPSPAGYLAMGKSVDLGLFRR
jgi:lysophospholipase L1-like esterase